MAVKSMTMYWLGEEPAKKLAVYKLNGKGVVELELLDENARSLAEEPMDGLLLHDPDGEQLAERVYPDDGEKFFQALIQQGRQLSYYDYTVDR